MSFKKSERKFAEKIKGKLKRDEIDDRTNGDRVKLGQGQSIRYLVSIGVLLEQIKGTHMTGIGQYIE